VYDLDVEDLDVGRGRRLTDGFEEAREERAERELFEQHPNRFPIPRPHAKGGRFHVDVAIKPQLRHLAVEEHPLARASRF